MKKITFEGKEYEVDDWVNWVARDCDGEINGYETPPKIIHEKYYDFWSCEVGKKWCHINDIGDWKNSLTEV